MFKPNDVNSSSTILAVSDTRLTEVLKFSLNKDDSGFDSNDIGQIFLTQQSAHKMGSEAEGSPSNQEFQQENY